MASMTFATGKIYDVPDSVTTQDAAWVWLKQNHPEDFPVELNATATAEGFAKPAEPGRLARFGRGLQDIATGAGQLTGTLPQVQSALTYLPGGAPAGSVGPRTDAEAEAIETAAVNEYEAGAGPGVDWWRIGGQATGMAPLVAIPGATGGLVTRTGAGALAGGFGGASIYARDEDERLGNVLWGTAGGGLGAAAAPLVLSAAGRAAQGIGRAGRRLWNALNPRTRMTVNVQLEQAAQRSGTSLSQMDDAMREAVEERAAEALRAGDLDADAIIRQAKLGRAGFEGTSAPLRSQVTRDPLQWGQERMLSQLDEGAPLQSRFSAQQGSARRSLTEAAEQYGEGAEPYEVGRIVSDITEERSKAWQARVGELYDEAERVAPDVDMPTDSLRAAWDETFPDFEDVMPGAVSRRVNEILDPEAARRATPAEIRALDQMVNRRLRSTTDGERREALRQVKAGIEQTLDDFAESGAGGDAFTEAYRAAKREAWQRASTIKPSARIRIVDDILSDKIAPEKLVENRIIGGSIDEVSTLRDFVSDQSADAWPKVQRSVMDWIYGKAVPNESGNVTPAGFHKALNRIGDRKLREIFGESGRARLRELDSAFYDMFVEPAPSGVTSVPRSGTPQNMARMLRMALRSVVGEDVANAGIGAVQRGASARANVRAVSEALNPQAGAPPLLSTPNPLATPRSLPYARGLGAGAGAAGLPVVGQNFRGR